MYLNYVLWLEVLANCLIIGSSSATFQVPKHRGNSQQWFQVVKHKSGTSFVPWKGYKTVFLSHAAWKIIVPVNIQKPCLTVNQVEKSLRKFIPNYVLQHPDLLVSKRYNYRFKMAEDLINKSVSVCKTFGVRMSELIDIPLPSVPQKLKDYVPDQHRVPKNWPPEKAKRTKRSWIDAGGNILNTVFGTATEEEVQGLLNQIDVIKNAETNLSTIADKQLSIVEQQGKQLSELHESFMSITQSEQSLEKIVSDIQINDNIQFLQWTIAESATELFEYASMLFNHVKNIEEGLLAASDGILSPNHISPDQLFEELKIQSEKLSSSLQFMYPPERSHHYYQEKLVSILPQEDGIAYKVNIPIYDPTLQFELYEPSIIPFQLENSSVTAYAYDLPEIFGVDKPKNLYIETTKEKLRHACSKGSVKVCPVGILLKSISTSPSCTSSLYTKDTKGVLQLCSKKVTLLKSDTAIQVMPKTWILSLAERTEVKLICPDSPDRKAVFERQMQIFLPPGCGLLSKRFFLPPQETTLQSSSIPDSSMLFYPSENTELFDLDQLQQLSKFVTERKVEDQNKANDTDLIRHLRGFKGKPVDYHLLHQTLKNTRDNVLENVKSLKGHLTSQGTWTTIALGMFIILGILGLFFIYKRGTLWIIKNKLKRNRSPRETRGEEMINLSSEVRREIEREEEGSNLSHIF